ncbi:hypothetical protein D3C79_972670 [compost metagenome]
MQVGQASQNFQIGCMLEIQPVVGQVQRLQLAEIPKCIGQRAQGVAFQVQVTQLRKTPQEFLEVGLATVG